MGLTGIVAMMLAAAASAGTLEVRGRLTDRNGNPQDGACLVKFSVAGAVSGVWSDSIYVDVEDGLFRALLGKDRGIPDMILAQEHRVAAEAPKGTGWQALASPMKEPPKAAARAPKKSESPPAAPAEADETARLKARIEALEKQLPQAPKPRTARVYEVRAGDTLQTIATKLWGDSTRWSELYSANADRLARGGDVTPGQKLVVPEVDR